MFNILTDRSRTIEFQRCPRSRFLQYEIGGRGVKPKSLDMNLTVGGCTHQGVQQLLDGKSVDEAVLAALEGDENNPGYWPKVKTQGLILAEGEDATFVQKEQAALVEAMVRVYDAVCLPKILDRFIILETEKEDLTGMPQYSTNERMDIDWQSRCDALLLEKDSGDLYAHSLKTAKEWSERNNREASHDMQGLSEIWAIDLRMSKWADILEALDAKEHGRVPVKDTPGFVPQWFVDRQKNGNAPQCFGVKMEYLLKGRREEYPKGSKRYTFNSPLVHPWKDSKNDLGKATWAWKYEWADDMDVTKKHRLGQSYKKVNIWEIMSIKEWISILAGRRVTPFDLDPLEAQTVLPMEYFRNDEDSRRWEMQTSFQEERVARGSKLANAARSAGDLQLYERILAEYFPMHTRACDWPYECSYQPVCFGATPSYLLDPLSAGIYAPRQPHHAPEVEKFLEVKQ